IPAIGRNFQRVEHRGVGWQLQVAHVRMPYRLARPQRADRLTAGIENVGDDVDVRITGRAEATALLVRRRVELTQPAAEAAEILITNVLPAQQEGGALVPDLGNLLKLPVR